MGDKGAIGSLTVGFEDWMKWVGLLDRLSGKYDVDRQEILMGINNIPPSDPACLVYVQMGPDFVNEYFRKNGQSYGRWVCWNSLTPKKANDLSLEGTYDFRKGIMYGSYRF